MLYIIERIEILTEKRRRLISDKNTLWPNGYAPSGVVSRIGAVTKKINTNNAMLKEMRRM